MSEAKSDGGQRPKESLIVQASQVPDFDISKLVMPDEELEALRKTRGWADLFSRELSGSSVLAGLSSNYVSALLGEDKKARELTEEISKLRKSVEETATALRKEKQSGEAKAASIKKLEGDLEQLGSKERLSFLLTRVNLIAQEKLLSSAEFRARFLTETECPAYVMSVDIRRSTELMLKARSPQQFAKFITTLCRELETVIKNHFGVFDKFTGDGVLAFFPEFFSGADAGYHVVAAAEECHRIFNERYRDFRGSFSSVLTEVGLGIGIDFGVTHLVQMAGGITVVGAPVVYACRLSGAEYGHTLLNQPGYEKVSEKYSAHCFFSESELQIKHEGMILAYDVKLNGKGFEPAKPAWFGEKPAGTKK